MSENRFSRKFAAGVAIAITCAVSVSTVVSAQSTAKPKPGETSKGAAPVAAGPTTSLKATETGAGDAKNNSATSGAKAENKNDTASSAKAGAGSVEASSGKSGEAPVSTPAAGVSAEKENSVSEQPAEATGEETANDKSAKASDATATKTKSADSTPLPEVAAEEEDPYANATKQQMQILQQHEAVQHFNASQFYMKKWDTELAELELRAAIMYMPDLKIAHRDYCLVALVRGKPLRALAEFCMVLGLGNPIPLSAEQQKKLRTEASQAHYKKGLDHAQEGKWDEAISELLWSRTYLPNDPAVTRSLAFAYASKGDFKMAQQYYQFTFEKDPGDAFARADFAFLLSQKGKNDLAVEQLTEAVKLDPKATALHVDLGWMAESKGDLSTAEKQFNIAAKQSPQHSALWMHLGEILEKETKTSAAIDAYKQALEAEHSNEEAKAALTRLGQSVDSTKLPKADVKLPG